MEPIINNERKIVGIVSAKGGVGKTTTAINIGASAANFLKKSVLILDANINTGNLALNLGLTYHPISMYSIIRDPISILNSIHKHKSGLHIIPSSLVNDGKKIRPSELNKKLKSLNNYDLILLDSAPGIGNDAKIAIKSSDFLLVVITPDFPTLETAMKTIEMAKKLKTPVEGIIINRVKNRKYELTKKYIERMLGFPVIMTIPEDEVVNEALSVRMPSVLYKKNSKSSKSFIELAGILFGKKIRRRGILKRFISGVFKFQII